MTQVTYPYKRVRSKRYVFISFGKKRIEKVVDFVPVGVGNIVNLGFGDLLPDGSIDDTSNSNNGDLVKVLATVIDILRHFANQNPNAEVFFNSSTPERTRLYNRIVRTYYSSFSQEFAISGIILVEEQLQAIPFESNREYLGFLVKRDKFEI